MDGDDERDEAYEEAVVLICDFLGDQDKAEEMARLPGAGNLDFLRYAIERASQPQVEDRKSYLWGHLKRPDRYRRPEVRPLQGEGKRPEPAWAPLYRYECANWRCGYSFMSRSRLEAVPACYYCQGPMRLDPEAYRMQL